MLRRRFAKHPKAELHKTNAAFHTVLIIIFFFISAVKYLFIFMDVYIKKSV